MPTGRGAALGQRASASAYESIVAAALDLLDEQGLMNVTLAAVAGRAGLSAAGMAAHFLDRAGLIAAMAEFLIQQTDATGRKGERIAPANGGAWREQLQAHGQDLRQAMMMRRDGGLLFASRTGENELQHALHTMLREAGFSPFDASATLQLLERFICGWVIAEQAVPALEENDSAPDFDGQLDTLLAGITVTRAWGGAAAKHRMFQAALWIFLRNARDSANIAFSRADHINELDRRILLLLQSQGDMTLAAVSTANGVDKAQISRAIKRLSQVGLVQRSGIRSPLKLSGSGRQLADRMVRLAELRNRELTFGISDEQLVDLFGVLDILLARAMALYERERKLAAAADAEIDFPDHEPMNLEANGGHVPVDRARILPPFITLCSYMMRGGALSYKRKTGLSNFDTWVLIEVSRQPPISWPQLVIALYRDQSQAWRTVKRLIELGLVERTGKPGRRHGFFAPTPEGERTAAIINGLAARRSEYLFQGIATPQLNNFMAGFEILARNAEVQLGREKAMQEMDRE